MEWSAVIAAGIGGAAGILANELLHRRSRDQSLSRERHQIYRRYLQHAERAKRVLAQTSHHPADSPPDEEVELMDERDGILAELHLIASASVLAAVSEIYHETIELAGGEGFDPHDAYLEVVERSQPDVVDAMRRDLGVPPLQ